MASSSEEARQALAAPLLAHGIFLQLTQAGDEALEHEGEERADAVLVDARHSVLDGLTVLKRLRTDESQSHLPVVLILSDEDRAERLLALKMGADDVLHAPWDEEELVARLRRSIALKRRVDSLVEEGRKLELLSVTDGLTQVHNHRFFCDRLSEEFRRAQRYEDALSLIILDLDHFKHVNDAHGHLSGDQVLRAVALATRKSLRDTDLLARYGGEEFAVLLPQTHLSGSLTVAERIRRDVQALKLGEQGLIRVTASLGVAGFPSVDVQTAEQLIAAADAALYRAKRDGRNRVCLPQPSAILTAGQAG